MNLEKAESLAKEKFREHLDTHKERLAQVKERIVIYSGALNEDWEVCLGILPKNSQSFEEFKEAPKWDDSEDQRAKDWIVALVRPDGSVELNEVNDLEELILI